MRIGMILDKTFPPDPRVENEAISLVEKGFEVFLFCLTYGGELESEVLNGIQVKRFRSNKLIYKLSALVYTVPFYSKIMERKISKFVKTNSIDAIHVHDMQIAQAVFNANKKSKLPVVLDLHDNMPEVIKFYPHLQKFPGKYLISPRKWKIKEEEFIQKATKVITVSQEFVDEVVERTRVAKDKVVLVPNTVQSSFYESAVINDQLVSRYKNDFVILYLGDTALRRGLLTAIEGVAILKNEIPNIKLVIVGKSTTDYVLKKRVSALNLTDFVDFEGWQNVGLFPSYIAASDVCISPLERSKQHDVAYANKLFQYMSFGKPVVVSDATAQKNLVERTTSGLVHLEKNPEDFSAKIMNLYEDVSLQKELGSNGKSFIENEFNWEETSKELIQLYSNLSL